MKAMWRWRVTLRSTDLKPNYRFIRTIQSPDHIVFDELKGRYRLSSKAFGPSTGDGCLSGDLEQLLAEDGLPALTMYPAVGRAVAAFSLKVQMICEQEWTYGVGVKHDPVRENWYHGSVFGAGLKKKKLKEIFRALAEEVVPIDQEEATRLDPARKDLLADGVTARPNYGVSDRLIT